ncbi:hypothetical protein PSEUBRA_002230 [Kalmanozyma brasiliensis GHG001]|uniref:uncharacterized protein n=1 Tax=Kalmanozyma brasiliensis (strain GHG001) TaxID=1365824 RepID=UPI0028680453|nr:uncharacterized protein PSEUBRA_002230 [Kalmanozyma brasiliensis GHG001]EST08146.2 hypothetical protein PSEUBRA_002230 [Kalmanozyma brasiliensis GHG001]
MRTQRSIALQCLALMLLALCALVSAQQSGSQTASSTQASATSNAPASSGTATSATSASGSNVASGTGSSTGSGSSITGSAGSTSSASSTSTTPTTFPIASVPTTGYLAGTAAAPVPGGGSGAQGTAALGPNDSHIVSAGAMLRASLPAISASIVAAGVGVWILL